MIIHRHPTDVGVFVGNSSLAFGEVYPTGKGDYYVQAYRKDSTGRGFFETRSKQSEAIQFLAAILLGEIGK